MGNLAYLEEDYFELLDGKIISMSPRPAVNHNVVIRNINTIFNIFLKGKSCTSFCDGVDVYLTEKDRVIPDVMIVCNKDIIKQNGVYGTPDLIVEVLSPGTAKYDKGYKKKLYEKCGVKEYWIVDTANRFIEVYLLKDGEFMLDDVHTLYPDYLLETMTEDEINKIPKKFKTSLYTDLVITIEDVFEGLF